MIQRREENRSIRIKTCASATLSNCNYVTFCIVFSFSLPFSQKHSFRHFAQNNTRFGFVIEVTVKIPLFWDVTSNSPLTGLKCFGRKYCLYLHDSTHRTVILNFNYSFPTEYLFTFNGSLKQ